MFRDEVTLLALSMVSGSGHCCWDPEPQYVLSFLGRQNVRRSAYITKHYSRPIAISCDSVRAGSRRQGVGTVQASSNISASL